MDIKEHFPNALRLHFWPDAQMWINVGVGNRSTDDVDHTLEDADHIVTQTVNFTQADLEKYKWEVYLVEKPYHNKAKLFITFVIEEKGNKVFEYIRPHGKYWDQLQSKQHGHSDLNSINTDPEYYPKLHARDFPNDDGMPVYSLPFYGHHQPNRTHFHLRGGACPSKGGDLAHYPSGDVGGGWPNNYEEITPMCDGILIDLKFWGNLWDEWKDPSLNLGNSAFDRNVVEFHAQANVFGEYTDPYLKDMENPHKLTLTHDGSTYPPQASLESMGNVAISVNFVHKGHAVDYHASAEAHVKKSLKVHDYCTYAKCDHPVEETCPLTAGTTSSIKEVNHCPASGCPGSEVMKPTQPTQPIQPIQPTQPNSEAQDALKMTYDIAKKMVGLALVLV